MVGFGPGVEEVLDELAGVADDEEEGDAGEEAEEGGALGWGALPGAWGGYSVRRSGRLVEVAMGFSFGAACWARTASDRLLPGDGFEQAEADEEAEGGGEQDGPGVGGKTEGRDGCEGWTWWSLLWRMRDAHERTCEWRLL